MSFSKKKHAIHTTVIKMADILVPWKYTKLFIMPKVEKKNFTIE